MKNTKLQLAFSFSAAEFLEEELAYLEKECNGPLDKDDDFLTKGKYVENKSKSIHKHEWWAPKYSIDNLNSIRQSAAKT